MKHIILFIIAFSFSLTAFAQADNSNYNVVTVVIDSADDDDQLISYYPEGTTYQVELIKKDAAPVITEEKVVYEGDMQLRVFPKYRKDEADQFAITGKRLRIFKTAAAAAEAGFVAEWNYSDKKETPTDYGKMELPAQKVTVSKKLEPSKITEGNYNVTLTFSNGVIFKYSDGKYNAQLNGESLRIKNKYIVETDDGILKFSFNPENGEVWWFYEAKKK
ncbi:MAG: hypothetical protein AAF573_12090 [Bacteroidota bacterium]